MQPSATRVGLIMPCRKFVELVTLLMSASRMTRLEFQPRQPLCSQNFMVVLSICRQMSAIYLNMAINYTYIAINPT